MSTLPEGPPAGRGAAGHRAGEETAVTAPDAVVAAVDRFIFLTFLSADDERDTRAPGANVHFHKIARTMVPA
jgi:hypothetical protein